MIKSRVNIINYATLAEVNHFKKECSKDFNKMMAEFLRAQVVFYQEIVDKLQEALLRFDNRS
ncbi:unnamed protein product [Soboliphyme baturini]|uniref:BAR_3_WASP_bdg domain-containing protein n=1 Tax=Soboliphyme baturini TaxID=241478 RepID=A0A183J208_9BILA|nr:unnamed protein product [Soboliphyme baturini]